jgi:hypothetical protein
LTSFHFSLPPPHSLISKIGFSENRALPRIRELDYNVPSARIWKVLLCTARHRLYAPVRRKTNAIMLILQAFHYDGGCPLSTYSAPSRILTIGLLLASPSWLNLAADPSASKVKGLAAMNATPGALDSADGQAPSHRSDFCSTAHHILYLLIFLCVQGLGAY